MDLNLLKCPNCNSFSVDEWINSDGGGSRYCLDGCSYEEKIPNGTYKPFRSEDLGYVRIPKKRANKKLNR